MPKSRASCQVGTDFFPNRNVSALLHKRSTAAARQQIHSQITNARSAGVWPPGTAVPKHRHEYPHGRLQRGLQLKPAARVPNQLPVHCGKHHRIRRVALNGLGHIQAADGQAAQTRAAAAGRERSATRRPDCPSLSCRASGRDARLLDEDVGMQGSAQEGMGVRGAKVQEHQRCLLRIC